MGTMGSRATSLDTPPCMGGWCAVRTSCRHYHATANGTPAERLCPAGTHDGWQPVLVTPRDIHEHHALAIVQGAARELRSPL